LNYQKLSNLNLVKECAIYPPNESAWREFVRRFDETIKNYAFRECHNKISSREIKQLSEIIQDRIGEVYGKLVAKEHKALKDFRGHNENSIYRYLAIMTRNTVINWVFREKKTQSRPNIDKSIDDSDENTPNSDRNINISTGTPAIIQQFDYQHKIGEIEAILNSFLRGKNKCRNKLIFQMHFYEGLTAQEIVDGLPYSMTLKTVQNILSNLKKIIQEGLAGGKRESI